MKHAALTAIAAVSIGFAVPALAQAENPYPFVNGEWVEVTGIDIDDGADLRYANWLAGEWRANEDFRVAQGWQNSYEIMINTHARAGEPDLYIIRRFDEFVDNAEQERRRQIMTERYARTEAALEEESAGRASYRTVLSTTLLRSMEWRD